MGEVSAKVGVNGVFIACKLVCTAKNHNCDVKHITIVMCVTHNALRCVAVWYVTLRYLLLEIGLYAWPRG